MKFLFYKSNHRIQEYTEYKSCLVSVIWGGLLGCWGRGSTNRGSVVWNRVNRSPGGAVQRSVQRSIWGAVQRSIWDRSGGDRGGSSSRSSVQRSPAASIER